MLGPRFGREQQPHEQESTITIDDFEDSSSTRTFSTTATGDNLPGPGRVIDTYIYQKYGRKLEALIHSYGETNKDLQLPLDDLEEVLISHTGGGVELAWKYPSTNQHVCGSASTSIDSIGPLEDKPGPRRTIYKHVNIMPLGLKMVSTDVTKRARQLDNNPKKNPFLPEADTISIRALSFSSFFSSEVQYQHKERTLDKIVLRVFPLNSLCPTPAQILHYISRLSPDICVSPMKMSNPDSTKDTQFKQLFLPGLLSLSRQSQFVFVLSFRNLALLLMMMIRSKSHSRAYAAFIALTRISLADNGYLKAFFSRFMRDHRRSSHLRFLARRCKSSYPGKVYLLSLSRIAYAAAILFDDDVVEEQSSDFPTLLRDELLEIQYVLLSSAWIFI